MLEILSAQLHKEQKAAVTKTLSYPNIQIIDVDRRVSGKASHIRQFYDDRVFFHDGSVKTGRIIGMGDAIHLATALQIEVSEMQTLDGSGRKKRKYDLLRLDGSVADARLAIKLPRFIEPLKPLTGPVISLPPSTQSSLFDAIDTVDVRHHDMATQEELIDSALEFLAMSIRLVQSK